MAIDIDFDAIKTALGDGDDAAGPDPDDAPEAVQETIRNIRGLASAALELERINPAVQGLSEDKATMMRRAREKWAELVKLGLPFLADTAKDLQVCANVTRGLSRLEGPEGLVKGLQIFQAVTETFWDTCWPRPDDDDWEERVEFLMQVTSEDDDLVRVLRRWPLTAGNESHTLEAFEKDATLHAEMSHAAAANPAYGEALITAAEAAGALLESLATQVREGTDFNEELDTALLRNQVVEALSRAVRSLYQATAAPAAAGEETDAGEASAGAIGAVAPASTISSPAAAMPALAAAPALNLTRDDCLVILQRVADFFVRTEPQAPTGTQLHDLVRRARLSFDQLLEESVPDYDARSDVYLRLGVKPPPQPEEQE